MHLVPIATKSYHIALLCQDPCIWYQLLPNPTICHLHANTHPCVWYQLLPNTIICHLHLNTHPCGSCTRNVNFVVRSNRSEIFIVFCMLRSWRSWILHCYFIVGSWRAWIFIFLFLRWDPGTFVWSWYPGDLVSWLSDGILYFATLPLPYFATRLRDTLYDCIWYGYGTNCYQILPYATSMLTPIHAFGTNCYQILRFATSMLTPIDAFGTNRYQILRFATSMLTPIYGFGTNCYQILSYATPILTPIHKGLLPGTFILL